MVKNMKAILWSILEKYDNNNDYITFCDSISNFIQNKENSQDMINVYLGLKIIDKQDKELINSTIGSKIDCYLFSF